MPTVATAREQAQRAALEVASASPVIRFAVALFGALADMGKIQPTRPPSTRARVTIIDTTAREIGPRSPTR